MSLLEFILSIQIFFDIRDLYFVDIIIEPFFFLLNFDIDYNDNFFLGR